MSADLSFAGRIYRDGRLAKLIMQVDTAKGTIVSIGKSGKLPQHIDFGNRAILPGGIDPHVHFREPGATHKEDFLSGSTAAAFGGITTVMDMPNTVPPTTSLTSLKAKHKLVQAKTVVDYGLWAGGSWYTGDLAQMLKWSVGVKAYLGATTGDLLLEDPKAFLEIMQICAAAGKPVILHAEAQRVLHQLRRTEMALADHDHARPPLAEVEAIYDVMKVLPKLKKPPRVHIAHIASVEAVEAAAHAKFSLGVCPHHLLLHHEGFNASHPGYGKMNPPLRSKAARDALWAMFVAGKLPVLESDHAPHTQVEKEDTFHNAPAGVPGVETMLPVLLAKAMAGDVKLATVVDAATAAPAALLGLKDRGVLAEGKRADFAVYDLEAVTAIDPAKLHSRCGWSPYSGMDAIFPTDTYLAGKPVVQDGALVAQPGSGRPVHALPE
jgi:dihydroorotase